MNKYKQGKMIERILLLILLAAVMYFALKTI
jgi:preprotein translocase subunit YajC